MTEKRADNPGNSTALVEGEFIDSAQEHIDPISVAAARNNMTVQEYVTAVREFAAYVATIILSRE